MSSFYSRIQEAIKGFRAGDPKYSMSGRIPRTKDAIIRIRIGDLEELMHHYQTLDNRARREHEIGNYGFDHSLILTQGSDREREGIITVLMMQLAIAGYDFTENTFVMEGRTYLGIRDRNKSRDFESISTTQTDLTIGRPVGWVP